MGCRLTSLNNQSSQQSTRCTCWCLIRIAPSAHDDREQLLRASAPFGTPGDGWAPEAPHCVLSQLPDRGIVGRRMAHTTETAFVVPLSHTAGLPLYNTSIPNIGPIGPRRSSSIPRRRPPSRRTAPKEVAREEERSATTSSPSAPSAAPAFNFDAHTAFQFHTASPSITESQSPVSSSYKRKCPHCAGSGFVSCECSCPTYCSLRLSPFFCL